MPIRTPGKREKEEEGIVRKRSKKYIDFRVRRARVESIDIVAEREASVDRAPSRKEFSKCDSKQAGEAPENAAQGFTATLESQRTYCEEKVAQAADKAATTSGDGEKATAKAAQLVSELKAPKAKHNTLLNETNPQTKAALKVEKLSGMAKRLEEEWKEEKCMNTGLLLKFDYLMKQTEERKRGK
ncbi:hypothetical protein BDZ91DRAFT_847891 [Kalaharituber pfeilii]|nr:hypothetical protein BDZ91DRAFT_847891 [Kalaharituber pfeilii]